MYLFQEPAGIFREAEVFRRESIYEFASLLERTRNENSAGKFDGNAGWTGGQFGKLPLDFTLHFTSEGMRRGYEDAGRVFCVFGLRQQIGGDPSRVAFGAQNDRFGRPRRQINRTIAADELFGRRDVLVAGAKDFFDAGN